MKYTIVKKSAPPTGIIILPDVMITLSYYTMGYDFIACFGATRASDGTDIVSKTSYEAVIKVLVELYGLIACIEAKLIDSNRD